MWELLRSSRNDLDFLRLGTKRGCLHTLFPTLENLHSVHTLLASAFSACTSWKHFLWIHISDRHCRSTMRRAFPKILFPKIIKFRFVTMKDTFRPLPLQRQVTPSGNHRIPPLRFFFHAEALARPQDLRRIKISE